jgi:uncharacterized membrane protein YdjX (TVP38/TMEM64 family)
MLSLIELLLVMLGSFGFNMIPFAGPSNLFIASNSALMLGVSDAWSLVAIGFLVALGAAFAKSIHYLVTFFVGKHLSAKQRQRLDSEAVKVKKWAFLLLFVAAATPIPDEPVVIPLGLLKYNVGKFFSAFFFGKLAITVVGAFLGSWTKTTFSEWLSPEVTVAISIVLTVVITVIMLKVDVGKLAARFLRRKTSTKSQEAS